MIATTTPAGAAVPPAPAPAAADPEIRRISDADLRWALAEGWNDFKAKRGDLIFAGFIYPVIGLLTAALATNDQLLPLFFPLVAGLSILGPAVASGFYELARRREEGSDGSWWHFLDPLKGRSREALISLTAGLAGLFVAWLVAAWLIYSVTIGGTPPAGPSEFFERLFGTPAGWTMIVLGNLVGLVMAAIALAFSVVSFPMVVDRPYDAASALRTSLRAFAANPRVVAGWGLRVAVLLAIGCLPAFVGLAVVLPVLGYATWHLYTRLVVR